MHVRGARGACLFEPLFCYVSSRPVYNGFIVASHNDPYIHRSSPSLLLKSLMERKYFSGHSFRGHNFYCTQIGYVSHSVTLKWDF